MVMMMMVMSVGGDGDYEFVDSGDDFFLSYI